MRRLIVIAAAMLATTALAAEKPITLTREANGQTVTAKVGQTITMKLDSNATTGFQWTAAHVNKAVLAAVGEPVYQAPKNGRPGQGGAQLFTWKAVKAGHTPVSLLYARPWEKDVKPVHVVSFTVVVK